MSQGFNAQCIPFEVSVQTNTYTEKEVLMPPTQGGMLPGIIRIEIEKPDDFDADGEYLKWHLSISSEPSIKTLNGNTILLAGEEFCHLAGAAYLTIEDKVITKDAPAPIITTMQKLYVGIHHLYGATHTIKGRVWFVPRAAPGLIQRQNLINQNQF